VLLVAALVTPAVVFDVLVAPQWLAGSPERRFIPELDVVQNAIAALAASSLVLVLVLVAKRVAPSWGGLRIRTRILYVVGVLACQLVVVAGAETALLLARGGIRLFEPTLQRTETAADGRRAYVYRGGLGCSSVVYVAPRYSLTMTRVLDLEGTGCSGAPPHVRWKDDGGIELVDGAGAPVRSHPFPLFNWGGGC